MLAGIKLSAQRWDWDYFLEQRKEVVALWPTGSQLASRSALEDAVAYHKQQAWWKFASLRNEQALKEERIQVVPQVGHALVEQTVGHIACSEDLGPDRWYVRAPWPRRWDQVSAPSIVRQKSSKLEKVRYTVISRASIASRPAPAHKPAGPPCARRRLAAGAGAGHPLRASRPGSDTWEIPRLACPTCRWRPCRRASPPASFQRCFWPGRERTRSPAPWQRHRSCSQRKEGPWRRPGETAPAGPRGAYAQRRVARRRGRCPVPLQGRSVRPAAR